MKIEIEVSEDVMDDVETSSIPFCVRLVKNAPYYDQDNYACMGTGDDRILRDTTIDGLYEQMGASVVEHKLYGERQAHKYSSDYPESGWDIEFSSIFVEVEAYCEDRMRSSKKFQDMGLTRESRKAEERKAQQEERERVKKWKAQQKEHHDREEYLRLCKKFATVKQPNRNNK